MKIFALSDLHLAHSVDKPMDVFGEHWADHVARMAAAWDALVDDEDWVLCPGDLSWGMSMDEAAADLAWIGARPGRKILGRGNHDYWWSSISKVRKALPEGCFALQNDAMDLGPIVVAGTRLWSLPGSPEFGIHDDKIFQREVGRLELSLKAAQKLSQGQKVIVVAVHYPPRSVEEESDFSRLLAAYDVRLCIYGHLHGEASHRTAIQDLQGAVRYRLVSSDFLQFSPICLDADIFGASA